MFVRLSCVSGISLNKFLNKSPNLHRSLKTQQTSIPVQLKKKSPKMENISNIKYGKLPEESPYVKPFRLYYTQNGKEKNWDLLKVHDSVSIIIFNKTRNVFVFVKQFRPAVYYGIVSAQNKEENIDMKKFPASLGVTLELCAGIVDKNKAMNEIAKEEVSEECGYDVPLENLHEVLTYRSGVGSTGALQTMFYCEVTDDEKTTTGGGVDDELIEVVECSVEEAKALFTQGNTVTSPPSMLLGVLWFLTTKLSGL